MSECVQLRRCICGDACRNPNGPMLPIEAFAGSGERCEACYRKRRRKKKPTREERLARLGQGLSRLQQ